VNIWDKYSNILFTDGACDNVITKKGAWSYILLYNQGRIEIQESGFETKTTNNRMELTAVIKGIQKIKELNLQGKTLVLSDSLITVRGASYIWERKNKNKYRNKKNKHEKKNLDLWNKLDKINFIIQARFIWIKGHSGLEYNEKCDDLAEVSYNLQQSYSRNIRRPNSIPLKEILPYVD
jgi:ribonuclease HI